MKNDEYYIRPRLHIDQVEMLLEVIKTIFRTPEVKGNFISGELSVLTDLQIKLEELWLLKKARLYAKGIGEAPAFIAPDESEPEPYVFQKLGPPKLENNDLYYDSETDTFKPTSELDQS